MKTSRMAAVLAMAGALATVAACDDNGNRTGSTFDEGTNTGNGTGTGTGSTPPEAVAVFSANEVASIALVLNQGEVAQAELAQQKAVSFEVRSFADRMAAEHTQAIQRIEMVGQASANEPTAAIIARHDQLVAQDLSQRSGADFDLAYMTTQIGAHAKALSMIDRALMPSAEGALRAELTAMRQAVEQHLDLAVLIHGRLRDPNTPR